MEEERFVLYGLGADPSSKHPACVFFISPTLVKLLSYFMVHEKDSSNSCASMRMQDKTNIKIRICHTASGLTFLISFIHYSSELEEKSESMKRNSCHFNSAKLRVNL